MSLIVERSDLFAQHFPNFPRDDQVKIAEFIIHCQTYGLTGLPGKIRHSDNVPGTDPDYYEKVRYARDNYLWHYHIGIPKFEQPTPWLPYFTSDYVLHFQRFPGNKVIRIVDLGDHNPMILPPKHYMVRS